MHLSLWLIDFVEIFGKAPEYVQWFILEVSYFMYKGRKIKTILYTYSATLDFSIARVKWHSNRASRTQNAGDKIFFQKKFSDESDSLSMMVYEISGRSSHQMRKTFASTELKFCGIRCCLSCVLTLVKIYQLKH